MCLILVSEVAVKPYPQEPEVPIGFEWYCCGSPVFTIYRDRGQVLPRGRTSITVTQGGSEGGGC